MISILVSLALSLITIHPSMAVRDVDGQIFRPFHVDGTAQILFFLSSECPISKFYAKEIQQICNEYGTHGVGCGLVYEDLSIDAAAIRAHLAEFGYHGIRAVADSTGSIAKDAAASVTPQAVVVDRNGKIRYRGRIDNYYADLGKPRRQATVHDLRVALDAIVAGRPVAVPETDAVGCFIVSPELFKEKK